MCQELVVISIKVLKKHNKDPKANPPMLVPHSVTCRFKEVRELLYTSFKISFLSEAQLFRTIVIALTKLIKQVILLCVVKKIWVAGKQIHLIP